MLLVGAGY